MILDIHSHHPGSMAILDTGTTPDKFPDARYISVGIHPWNTVESIAESTWQALESAAQSDRVVAIGECGIDKLRGGAMFQQLNIFKRQIELAETLRKPLIIHAVKADDYICALRRDLKPEMPWVVHGYRGKPAAAAQLLRCGCYLSFGEKFNSDTLLACPQNRILAETDESNLGIEEIISRLSTVTGSDLTPIIASNSNFFCNFES